jgi:hypothetical protein
VAKTPFSETEVALADRMSDVIIDAINSERLKPGFNPVAALAGVLLGLKGYLQTSPKENNPASLIALKLCVDLVLDDFLTVERTQPEVPPNGQRHNTAVS